MIHLAQFISFLFNPLMFMLVLPYAVVFRQTENMLYALKWQLFTSLFVFAMALIFLFGKWQGIFSDLDVSKREERPRMFFMVFAIATAYLLTAVFFKGILFPVSIIAFGVCVAVVAFTIINYRVKASGHVAVACAFIFTVGSLYGLGAFWATFWIVPLVAWSRILLRKHTLREVVTGGLLGTVITVGTFLAGKYIYQYTP